MRTFEIRSQDGAILALSSPDSDAFTATLTGEGLSAEVEVLHYEGDQLAEFFAGLAKTAADGRVSAVGDRLKMH